VADVEMGGLGESIFEGSFGVGHDDLRIESADASVPGGTGAVPRGG
jgi:hypothetical protein